MPSHGDSNQPENPTWKPSLTTPTSRSPSPRKANLPETSNELRYQKDAEHLEPDSAPSALTTRNMNTDTKKARNSANKC
jgi:hypothetical protein